MLLYLYSWLVTEIGLATAGHAFFVRYRPKTGDLARAHMTYSCREHMEPLWKAGYWSSPFLVYLGVAGIQWVIVHIYGDSE